MITDKYKLDSSSPLKKGWEIKKKKKKNTSGSKTRAPKTGPYSKAAMERRRANSLNKPNKG